MDIAVPDGITSITFATAGAKVPSAGVVSGVGDEEGTQVCASYNRPKVGACNLSTGAIDVQVAPQITQIVINGNTINFTDGVATGVAAADATILFNRGWLMNGFRYVS